MKVFNQLSGKKPAPPENCQVVLKKKGWQQSSIFFFLSIEEGFHTDANCLARKGLAHGQRNF